MANITKWGILATGGISQSSFLAKAGRSIANINFKSIEFAKDIQIDPKTREVQDIIHQIVAVGSSSGLDRAQDFVKEHCNNDPNVKAYGNYKDFLADEVSFPQYHSTWPAGHSSHPSLNHRTFKSSTLARRTVSIGPTPGIAFLLASQWALQAI